MASDDSRRFIAALSDMQRRISYLESSIRQPQLGKSSMHDDFLHVYDAQGQVRQRIGKQADGSFAVSYQNGVQPPTPTDPTVLSRQLSLAVFWDGTFGGGVDRRPSDFARVDVHVSTSPGFIPDGSTVIGSLNSSGAVSFFADSEPHYVKIVAVNTAEIASAATDEIMASPMPATEIAAGSIGAEQLAAEIVLSTKLVAGDPAAARLEMSAAGVKQFNEDGQQTVSLGSDPSQGNYLSVADPSNSVETLATLSDDGGLSVQKLAVAGDARFGGKLLSDLIAAESGGCVARAKFDASSTSPSTTSSTAWFEVGFQAVAGRLYRIQSGPFISRGGGTDIRMRYTRNGVAPSVSSPILTRAGANDGETIPPQSMVETFDGDYVRILLCVESWAGANVHVEVLDVQKAQFWIEDIGLDPGNTGSLINSGGGGGGGSQPKPVTTYTTRWYPAWMQAFNQHGLRGDAAAQGYYDSYNGDGTIMVGFDDVDIRAKLSGSTVNAIRFYIYSWHWYYNSGGYAAIGSHNVGGAAPTSYSLNHFNIVEAHMPKPGGVWIDLPVWLGNEFRDNSTKGINLDAIYRGHDLNYYGKFNWPWDPSPPALEIVYTK